MKFCRSLFFIQFEKKIDAGNVCEGVLSESSPGNQCSESHALLRGVNEFVSVLATFII